MFRSVLFTTLLLVLFTSCQKDNALAPEHSEKDIPAWLQIKINSISTDQFYHHSEVYRYEWKGKNVYHLMVPLSSCAYCMLYSEDGNVLNLSVEEFSDFMEHKKNEGLVWEWKDE